MPRTIPSAFADRLNAGAASITECVLITPNWGSPVGLTKYVNDITFGGVTYHARPGMLISKVESTLELTAANATGSTMIDDILVTTPDVLSGRFDRAKFTHMLVDADDPTCGTGTPQTVTLLSGRIGALSITGRVIQAELKSLTSLLEAQFGAALSPACRVKRLGDSICKKDLAGAGPGGQLYRTNGTVTAVLGDASFNASGLATITDDNWFLNGYLTWTSGQNSGQEVEISGHKVAGSFIQLFMAPGMPIQVGDTFNAEAGCNRTMTSCDTKFSNRKNYDAEPFVVGDTDISVGADGRVGQ